jgi:hypothetical protein
VVCAVIGRLLKLTATSHVPVVAIVAIARDRLALEFYSRTLAADKRRGKA